LFPTTEVDIVGPPTGASVNEEFMALFEVFAAPAPEKL
jgi:hypothetical protein